MLQTRVFIVMLCVLTSILASAQNKILYRVDTKEKLVTESATSKLKVLVIELPSANFTSLSVQINRSTSFSFTSPELIRAADIDSGRVTFKFYDGNLVAVGGRSYDPIKIDSTIIVKRGQSVLDSIVIYKRPSTAAQTKIESNSFQSKFCLGKDSAARLNGLPNFTFLCNEQRVDTTCKCGKNIKSPFENRYLPPCFARDEDAVSVNSVVWYDMTATDPLRRVYLLEVKKKEGNNKDNCPIINGWSYQYLSAKDELKPKVGKLLGIAVIAHKDSIVIIDSSMRNYFLDSADIVRNTFDKVGSYNDTSQKLISKGGETANKVSDSSLRGAITLRNDLITFNSQHSNLDFLQQKYFEELACLQKNIITFFGLSIVPKSGAALALALETRIEPFIQSISDSASRQAHRALACQILNQIAQEFDIALNRKGNYVMYAKVLQVPDADEFSLGIRTKNMKEPSFQYDFQVKGGIKIDFSAGIFATGLNSRDYVLRSARLRYNTGGANPVVRDTIGNVIQRNDGQFNFNTGFLVHVYWRSGRGDNSGFVAGATINNSEFMMLLGGSQMFRFKNNRLALVAGVAFGRRQTLDANHQQYYQTDEILRSRGVYNVDELPRFFTETNISTYYKKNLSWFAGITYNFASVKL